ncbi:MAG TPA: hypothetical protein VGV35_19300, partial [Bryobacteraceae bacterium]|nr:hypothetical protein [Bryobacteraceae bacterium]
MRHVVLLLILETAWIAAAQDPPALQPQPRPYRIGGGVTAPTVVWKQQPEYSEEARMAWMEGTVVLLVV